MRTSFQGSFFAGTLLNCVGGLDDADFGRVVINGRDSFPTVRGPSRQIREMTVVDTIGAD
ncbi:MAG: hypothetical protein K2P59_03930 [Acetatifactor sp.]|nr:hypothetical protein [Acetatifactor sp.]